MHRIKEYIRNSSIHGFHYIADANRHWTERIFWLVVCTFSGYYTYLFLTDLFYAFENNAVRFVIETDYLNWNTTFPAVSICEQESPDKLFEISQKLYGNDRDMNIDFYLRDITFFDGACYSCSYCSNKHMNCTEDFDLIISKIKESCENLIGNCTWDNRPFSCCDNFLPLRTESGLCYTINSIQTTKKWNSLATLKSNRKTGPGKLEVRAFESVKVFVHSPEDVPNVNHNQDEKILLNWGSSFVMIMKVREIENDRALSLVSIAQRKCRLPAESNLNVYTYYSYSACLVSCRARVQMKLCNCSSHYIPYNRKDGVVTCGVAGLACLTRHAETLRALRKVDLMKFGLNECQCMSSCSEPEYTVLSSDVELKKQDQSNDSYGTKITVALDRLPTERYKRTVVRTRLDLAVSIGSIFGLFLGASVLSLIEVVYYLCIRMHNFDTDTLKKSTHQLNTRKISPSVISPKLIMVTPKSDLLMAPYLTQARRKNLQTNTKHWF